MTSQRKRMIAITGTFLAILLAIVFGLVQQDRYDYVQNVLIKMVVWIIYTLFEIKCGINVSNYSRYGVMAVIISDCFFGLYLDLYNTSVIFDKIQHVFGSYAFSLFMYSIIHNLTQPMIGRGFTFIFILALGLSIGALYEVGEFLGDSIAKPRIPSQPNLLDTDLDLIADIIGSLIAAVHATNILVGNFKDNLR